MSQLINSNNKEVGESGVNVSVFKSSYLFLPQILSGNSGLRMLETFRKYYINSNARLRLYIFDFERTRGKKPTLIEFEDRM